MMRAAAGCVLLLLGSAAACGGPTEPASPAPSPPPVSVPSPPGISLVSSDPVSGGETDAASSPTRGTPPQPKLQLVFSVAYDVALPDAKFEVELFDGDGTRCWYTFVDHAVPAGIREQIAVSGWTSDDGASARGCPAFPQHIVAVKATLLTLREPQVNFRLQRTDYLSQSFPVSYTIQRYPPPPSGVPQSPPAITELTWGCGTGCSGGSGPLPDDPFSVTCVVRETDGAPITAAGTITWEGLPPRTFSKSFPAGASSSPEGVRFYFGQAAPNAPHATVLCVATNDRGESVQKTIVVK